MLISFDLQGTLSDAAFSDEFWLELLPSLYAQNKGIRKEEAKNLLEQEFKAKGRYHELFYNHRLRLDALLPEWEFQQILSLLKNKAALDEELLQMIKARHPSIPLIIISATTRDFIDWELGQAKNDFQAIFSSIDDLKTPGKPPKVFQQIARLMKAQAKDCFHIGDCLEMDYINAKKAGWQSFHWNRSDPKELRLAHLREALDQFISKMDDKNHVSVG